MTTEERLSNLENGITQIAIVVGRQDARIKALETSDAPVQAVERAAGVVGGWFSAVWSWALPVLRWGAPYAATALLVLLLTGQLAIPGCPGPTPTPPVPAEVKLTINPPSATVEVGKSIQFSSAFSDGSNHPTVWSVSGAKGILDVGTIDQSGKFMAGREPGSVVVGLSSDSLPPDKRTVWAKVTVTASPLPPAPIPVDGFRAMFVYDQTKLLPQSQADIFTSTDLREYLDAHCAKAANGNTEWRMWPHTATLEKETKVWQDAWARPHQTLPWLVVSDGKSGWEGPLPTTLDETMKLLQKFGGP